MQALKITEEVIEFLVDSARYGDLDDVIAALQHGVPADSRDADGRTALHMACANGHTSIAERLINAGANVDAKNMEGSTPLHWACLNNQREVVKLLMDKGATAAILNSVGRTPIDEALDKNFQHLVDLINLYTSGAGVAVDQYEDPEEAANAAEASLEVFTPPAATASAPAACTADSDMDLAEASSTATDTHSATIDGHAAATSASAASGVAPAPADRTQLDAGQVAAPDADGPGDRMDADVSDRPAGVEAATVAPGNAGMEVDTPHHSSTASQGAAASTEFTAVHADPATHRMDAQHHAATCEGAESHLGAESHHGQSSQISQQAHGGPAVAASHASHAERNGQQMDVGPSQDPAHQLSNLSIHNEH